MELEERIELIENDLAQVKVDIKQVLVDLKDLILRDQNPLAAPEGDGLAADDLFNQAAMVLSRAKGES